MRVTIDIPNDLKQPVVDAGRMLFGVHTMRESCEQFVLYGMKLFLEAQKKALGQIEKETLYGKENMDETGYLGDGQEAAGIRVWGDGSCDEETGEALA